MIEKLYDENGILAYEGETLYGKPYGFGTVYWPDGHIRQQGIFDIKGIVEGKLFYPDGTLRFEGLFAICHGYGPNYPTRGRLYDQQGKLIFSGTFTVKKGGVGYPTVVEPAKFGPCSTIAHLPVEVFSWNDERQAYLDAGEEPPKHI